MSEITRNEAIRIVEDIRTAISAGSVTNTMEAQVLEYCVVVLGRSIEEASQSGSIVNLPDVVAFLAGISSSTTLRELLSDITGKIPSEASSANKLADKAFVTTAINGLQNALNNINTNIGNGYVYAGIATPSVTPVSGKVFYLAKQAGRYTNFGGLTVTEGLNILKRNGSAWSQEQLMSMADIYKNPLIGYYECDTAGDTAAKAVTAAGYVLPTTGGSMKIKMANRNTVANATLNINSTGAKPLYYNGQRASADNTWDTNEVIEVFYDGTNYQAHNVAGSNGDGVFDISAYNLTDGQPTPYENLEAALGQDGDNVPRSLRKGGMSIKFVRSPDKYVQYRCMAQSFTTDVTQWQGVDNTPMIDSKNLIESGCVYPLQAKIFGGNLLGAPKNGMIVTEGKYSRGNNVAKHYLVPVSQGDVVYIKWNSVNDPFYCVLNTYNFVAGQYCDFATGWDAVKHLQENTFEIPSDGHYLYILYIGSTGSDIHTPDIVKINGEDYILKPLDTIIDGINDNIDSISDDIDSLEESIADINDEVFGYHRELVIVNGSVASNGNVTVDGTCCFIPFTDGDTAIITSNSNKKASYVLVNSYNMQSKTITYATGYSVPIEIPVNQSSSLITAPSDCNYLFIRNTDKYDTSYFPSKIIINGEDYLDKPSLNAKIIAVDSKIDALEESMKAPAFSAFEEQEQQLIHNVLSDKDSNTITFGLITDTHNSLTSAVRRTAKQAYYIGKLCELASASFVVNLGDVIHGSKSTHQENMDDLVDYWKQGHRTFIPTLYTIAHHEQYGEDGEFQNYPSSLYPTECIGVYGMTNRYVNVNWSSDKTSWYFDENGVRFIGLNSSSNGSLGFSQEVINFLQTALNTCTTPVVCMAHVVCNTNINYGIARNEEVIETALSNYQHGVIAYFHGHTHWDMIWKLTGIPYLYWSTCCAQAVQTAIDYKHAPVIGVPENYVRTVGDYSEFCFDIVNIHKDTNEIHSFRFGAGYDRIAKQGYAVSVGQTLTLESSLTGTVEWDIYDSTSGYVKDSTEQTATQVITRDVATINNGIVTALSTGESIAVSTDGKTKEFFFINVN